MFAVTPAAVVVHITDPLVVPHAPQLEELVQPCANTPDESRPNSGLYNMLLPAEPPVGVNVTVGTRHCGP